MTGTVSLRLAMEALIVESLAYLAKSSHSPPDTNKKSHSSTASNNFLYLSPKLKHELLHFIYQKSFTQTWHSMVSSRFLPARAPSDWTAFIKAGWPVRSTWSQPSCFPANEAISRTVTFDQSQFIRSSTMCSIGNSGY